MTSSFASDVEYMRMLRYNIKLASITGFSYMHWDGKEAIYKSGKLNLLEKSVHVTALSATLFACVRLYGIAKQNEFAHYMSSILLLAGIINGVVVFFASQARKEEITHYFNSMIYTDAIRSQREEGKDGNKQIQQINQKLSVTDFIKLTKKSAGRIRKNVTRGVAYGAIPLATLSPAFFATCALLILLFAPCTLSIMSRSGFTDCEDFGGFFRSSRLELAPIVIFTDITMFFIYFNSGAAGFGCLFYFPLSMMRSQYEWLHEKVAKMNASFNVSTSMKIYQDFHLLVKLFNNYARRELTPDLIWTMFALATIGIYACIGLREKLPFPMLMLAATITFDMTYIGEFMMIRAGGDINDFSRRVRLIWKTSKVVATSKYYQRKQWSISEVKVNIGGSGNYIEKLSAANLLQMTIEQAISLLLATKSQ